MGWACAALGSQQSAVVGLSARWGRVRYVLGMVPCSPGPLLQVYRPTANKILDSKYYRNATVGR